MVTGETNNYLSPMFPVGGKWFNHYDERRHILTIACVDCAQAGKAGTCAHSKSTIALFSSELGREVLQGAVYTLVHFDEDCPEEFYAEARQRTQTAKYGCLILTGTPLSGQLAWEQTRVAAKVLSSDNTRENGDPEVSLHTVNVFDAGLVPHERVRNEIKHLDKFEVDARIYGKPVNIADNPVFDRQVLEELIEKCVSRPIRGNVIPKAEKGVVPAYHTLSEKSVMEFFDSGSGPLRVWKRPEPGEVYVAGVDTAAGLTNGDWSCASIVRVFESGGTLAFELVAQYHAKINPTDYADALLPLLIWYNSALCAVELTGGLGRAVVTRLKNEHAYWNMYREQIDPTLIEMRLESRIGVETSSSSKPFMVAALQKFIKDRHTVIPCSDTILELSAFEQETRSKAGTALVSPKYRGAKSSPDDRVMSLAIIAGVAITYQPLIFAVQYRVEAKNTAAVSKDMEAVHKQLSDERIERLLGSGWI
jgi:phage terminase large subunit-like protein